MTHQSAAGDEKRRFRPYSRPQSTSGEWAQNRSESPRGGNCLLCATAVALKRAARVNQTDTVKAEGVWHKNYLEGCLEESLPRRKVHLAKSSSDQPKNNGTAHRWTWKGHTN